MLELRVRQGVCVAGRDELKLADREEHASATQTFVALPDDVVFLILDLLEPLDFLQLRKTCRRFAGITRARVVWVRAVQHDMHKYRVKDATNLVQPTSHSGATLEHIALRPRRFAAALARHDPRAAPQLSYTLRATPGFNPRATSSIVHGRWLAVVSDTAVDPHGIVIPDISWADAPGKVVLFDLGHGRNSGLGAPVPRLTLPFSGKGLLVDLVALPDTELVFLGFAYGANRRESTYEGHLVNLDGDRFGKLDPSHSQIKAATITETSFCGSKLALDIIDGIVCVYDFYKQTFGMITCRQLQSRAGSVGKSIQLTSTSILVADPFNMRVYVLPMPPMVPVRSTSHMNAIFVAASELIQLPLDPIALSVRFLPLPPMSLGAVATLHTFEPLSRRHSFLHFSCTPLVFGDPPCVTYSVSEAGNFGPLASLHSAMCARTGDKLLAFTHLPWGLAVVATPAFDASEAVKVEDAMDGVELEHSAHKAFVVAEPGWRVLTGSLVGGDGPRTKRTGLAVDELSARVVLLEVAGGQHRVRVIEYV